jgi:hypothetical protein
MKCTLARKQRAWRLTLNKSNAAAAAAAAAAEVLFIFISLAALVRVVMG